MPDLKYDVLGIGNAIVDVIARAEDDFLVKQGMHKGGMALIDEPRAQAIYQAMGISPETSYEIEKRPVYVTRDGKGKPIDALFS